MDPVSAGFAGANAGLGLISGLYNLLGRKKPKFHGASGQSRAALAQTTAVADKLASGTGLSESQYNRYLEGAREQAQQNIQAGTEFARANPFLSSAAAERVAKEMLGKSQTVMQKATTEALLADVNTAQRNLEKSTELYAKSSQMAEDIRKADEAARQAEEDYNNQVIENFMKLGGSVVQGAGAIAGGVKGAATTKPDEFADYWANTTKAADTVVDTTAETVTPSTATPGMVFPSTAGSKTVGMTTDEFVSSAKLAGAAATAMRKPMYDKIQELPEYQIESREQQISQDQRVLRDMMEGQDALRLGESRDRWPKPGGYRAEEQTESFIMLQNLFKDDPEMLDSLIESSGLFEE